MSQDSTPRAWGGKLHSEDLAGRRFGRWTVLRHSERAYRWVCRCECGTEKDVQQWPLLRGESTSCGCAAREISAKRLAKHNGSYTGEYSVWQAMKSRCFNPNVKGYHRYGGRGITVCRRWAKSFQDFLEDMGPRPTPKHKIDRIDNDGNYEPGNCRWATNREQGRNTSKNRFLTWQGETRTLAEWSEITGINRVSIAQRIDRYGWSVDRALSTPGR